ncbi:MAG: hypothetical protein SLAVMIC_00470 [uncultured marine phage]|uniref:Uncharacterized protein n=1 Tax=uncultured marine phage TaxID=707152 RepID=A0A8D9CA34_9VIRU|nr:MAG: hypothetical protein SLAVMIC_00470 [uncultured marine phage]
MGYLDNKREEYFCEIKYLYIGSDLNIKSLDPLKDIKGILSDDSKETLINLIRVKNIYDRRNISNTKLDSEISNYKMKLREDRLSIILDKNAAK